MIKAQKDNLDAMFSPRAIAIVGASPDASKLNGRVLRFQLLCTIFVGLCWLPALAQEPRINAGGGVLNGASFTRQLVAGSIAAVFGTGLSEASAPAGTVPSQPGPDLRNEWLSCICL